ncbi:type I-E CRISPR-associated endoribonuclease Cas2e [Thermobifida fusca]|uniref:type I-E CRISPR-associated endoribonuclease Cas2e n=1 Tax=Thermobifida fusca TaxID=2021 RepID=UPI0009D72C06|nr:type I-E CRISPR-associated endoribonuclease Cas2e [Thermobifida fusca]PZN61034.1 MAG: type I-E CRISPR-associated endoribonuclease Cas2 [Thermobifida fusca]
MAKLVMIATTAVPNHVRGALSRWMIEPVAGVYVGTMSARVRDELWSAVSASVGDGAALCVHPDDNEQGFTVRTAGERRRAIVDFDGLQLVQLSASEGAEQEMPPIPEGW